MPLVFEFRPAPSVFGRLGQQQPVPVPPATPRPLVTTAEGIALLAGAVLTAVGITSKFRPAELVGELGLAAGIFSMVCRHSV